MRNDKRCHYVLFVVFWSCVHWIFNQTKSTLNCRTTIAFIYLGIATCYMFVFVSKWLGWSSFKLYTFHLSLVFAWSFFHLLSWSTIRKWWKVGFLSVTLTQDSKKLTWQIQVLQKVILFYQPFHMSYFLWTISPIPIGH